MTAPPPTRIYRFGVFEADTATGELRRQGVRVKLNAQPFQVLLMLIERAGTLLSREEISRELWPDGTFVDYEHGLNSAVNRIREALGDTATNPRYIETLARRGYRFLAPVELVEVAAATETAPVEVPATPTAEPFDSPAGLQAFDTSTDVREAAQVSERSTPEAQVRTSILAAPHELPKASYALVHTLFVLLQMMYLSFYVGALANLPEIEGLLSAVPKAAHAFTLLIVTAAVLIPIRFFVLFSALFHAPGVRQKFLRIWPFLFLLDELWSLAPFLLLHHMDFGLALASTTLLVYAPFAQRSLVLMGAGDAKA